MSKYIKGDSVRVTDPAHEKFDQVGVVLSVSRGPRWWVYDVGFGPWPSLIAEHHLILAIPPVEDVLAEMGRESA